MSRFLLNWNDELPISGMVSARYSLDDEISPAAWIFEDRDDFANGGGFVYNWHFDKDHDSNKDFLTLDACKKACDRALKRAGYRLVSKKLAVMI